MNVIKFIFFFLIFGKLLWFNLKSPTDNNDNFRYSDTPQCVTTPTLNHTRQQLATQLSQISFHISTNGPFL